MKRPTQQIYSDYTAEDFLVWKTLYERQMPQLRQYACDAYLRAVDTVEFNGDAIPDFARVNEILAQCTGWGIHVVPCISPAREFFGFLAEKKFTATCWVRTMAQLDYIEEPDMFHDVFAHIPLLSDPDYCRFLTGLGELAMEHADDDEALELIGRFYWFTIEFGLMRQADGSLRIYGAGIMSSRGETLHCMVGDSTRKDYNVRDIMATPYRNDIMQDTYFIVESFEQLYHSLDEVRVVLAEMTGVAKVQPV